MAAWAGLLAILLPVATGLGLVGLAALVFRQARHLRHSVIFAALYFLSGVKSLTEGLGPVADSWHQTAPLFPGAARLRDIGVLCAFFMAPLLLWFILEFPRPARVLRGHAHRGWGFLAIGALSAAVYFLRPRDWVPGEPLPWQVSYLFLFEAAVALLTVFAVFRLSATRRSSPDAIERRQSRYLLVGFLPAFLATWFLTAEDLLLFRAWRTQDAAYAPPFGTLYADVIQYYSPVAELLAASVVSFAILKYQILGAERKAKVGVRNVVFGAILATIFLFTQFVENVILQGKLFAFAGDYGSFLLSGMAGIVLFRPIEKVSRKASDRLFPDTAKPEAAYLAQRAAEIYHAQCTYVLRDAHVSDRELRFLQNLRAQLGLAEAEARRIEEEVERILKVDAPQTGQGPAEALPSPGPAAAVGPVAADSPETPSGPPSANPPSSGNP